MSSSHAGQAASSPALVRPCLRLSTLTRPSMSGPQTADPCSCSGHPALQSSAPAPSSFQYGQSPYAAPPASAPSQPSFQQQDNEPESEAITTWKAKQAEEIKARDEKSKVRSQNTVGQRDLCTLRAGRDWVLSNAHLAPCSHLCSRPRGRRQLPRPSRRLTSTTRTTTPERRSRSRRTSTSLSPLLACRTRKRLADRSFAVLPSSRQNEAKFLEDLSASLSAGTTWERIADLVGLENSRKSTPSLPPFSFKACHIDLVTG